MTVEAFWERYPYGVVIEITYADMFHQIQKGGVRRLSELGRLQESPGQGRDLSIHDLYCRYVAVREIEGPLTSPTVHVYCGCPENHPR